MQKYDRHPPRKVILVEFNEITWRFLDPLLKKGVLPTFAKFIASGVRGAPVATEDSKNLDPWISWTSFYTGRRRKSTAFGFWSSPRKQSPVLESGNSPPIPANRSASTDRS